MDKKEVVLKLSMEDAKKRAKVMKCAVGVRGVVSASVEGDKIKVVGEKIDPVALTTLLRKKMGLRTLLLRKKMGYVELMKVETVEEKKKEKEAEAKSTIHPSISPSYYGQPSYYYFREPSYDPNICSII